MESSKAAAYYEELTRKGAAAARFKQGLGFSSTSSSPSTNTTASSSSSSLNNFVRASSPTKLGFIQKQAQVSRIHEKLKKKGENSSGSTPFEDIRDRDRDRDRERRRRRQRSGSRERRGEDEEERWSRRRRRSRSKERRRDDYDDDDDERRHRRKSLERSREPKEAKKERNEKNDVVDYSRLIDGYDKMTPAERVKAKMKLQLSQTAQKDSTIGSGSGWERFDFDKDAPLDDEEMEVTDDDVAVVKRIGQSFRFSKIEARREEEIKVAHDAAMFGAPAFPPSVSSDSEQDGEDEKIETNAKDTATDLISDKVLVKQQGSWRDRVRKGAT